MAAAKQANHASKSTNGKSANGKSSNGKSTAKSKGMDAIALLKADHRKVEALFQEFDEAADSRTQERVVREICKELTIHAKLEEKIFYPAAKEDVPEAGDKVNEGFVEHEGIKRLVHDLEGMSTKDEFFETRVKVLKEYVKHHVKEEENSMFPSIREGDIDLVVLGEAMQKSKERMQAGARKKAAPARRAAARPARAKPRGESRASA